MAANESNLSKVAKSVEQAINAALTMDPSAQKHLKRLMGCVLALDVTSTDSTFFFGVKAPDEENNIDHYFVELLPHQDASTVQIGGSILSLVKIILLRFKFIILLITELV